MSQIKRIAQSDILLIDSTVPFPMVIFSSQHILFSNELFKQLGFPSSDLFEYAKSHTSEESVSDEIFVEDQDGEVKSYRIYRQTVIIDEKTYYMAFIVDCTVNREKVIKLEKMCRLRERMLDINNTIVTMTDLNEALQVILENALKAIEKASMGSVFLFQNNHFKIASYIGFTRELEGFQLPMKDAFLYRATDGKMDRIVSCGDFQNYDRYHKIKTTLGDDYPIQSTISSPIFVKETFIGMINIDAVTKNAFNEEDMKSMEFVRKNIEIAITNFLSFNRSSSQAKHDSLTQLYNRYFFAEQFQVIKENAIEASASFYILMIDIDGLKDINDQFGHLAGDKVIVRISSELFKHSTKTDIIARFGGDEFVGIFLNITEKALSAKLDKITSNMAKDPIVFETTKIAPSFTYGFSKFGVDGNELTELIKVADERMYTKKKAKKGLINTN